MKNNQYRQLLTFQELDLSFNSSVYELNCEIMTSSNDSDDYDYETPPSVSYSTTEPYRLLYLLYVHVACASVCWSGVQGLCTHECCIALLADYGATHIVHSTLLGVWVHVSNNTDKTACSNKLCLRAMVSWTEMVLLVVNYFISFTLVTSTSICTLCALECPYTCPCMYMCSLLTLLTRHGAVKYM